MKAIVYEKYGLPEVLQLKEVKKPTLKDDEVLVKVRSASVNPADWHTLRATNFLVRLEAGLLKPKNKILRADVAGRVEAVGRHVKQFQLGDDVFGRSYGGGYAEYACIPESRLALKPDNLSFEAAAAVPLAALTGLQGLRKGQIRPGQRVLINGASGGIGTFAVQIAKSYGAEVIGVCSTRNLEMVRSIGADDVIDYTQEAVGQHDGCYDLIIDAVGNLSVADYKHLLGPSGICVVLGFENPVRMFQVIFQGGWASMTGSQKIGLMVATINREDLVYMKSLIEAGNVVPVIDRRYSFQEIPEALSYLGKKHARGKVVISL